jgi:hypothetical protein
LQAAGYLVSLKEVCNSSSSFYYVFDEIIDARCHSPILVVNGQVFKLGPRPVELHLFIYLFFLFGTTPPIPDSEPGPPFVRREKAATFWFPSFDRCNRLVEKSESTTLTE